MCIRDRDTLDDEFRESVLVGQVLGKNQLGIGDGWIALRVEQFIKEGLLLPIDVYKRQDHRSAWRN